MNPKTIPGIDENLTSNSNDVSNNKDKNILKINGNFNVDLNINFDYEIKKKHAYIGGGVGGFVLILIIGTVLFFWCQTIQRRKRRDR